MTDKPSCSLCGEPMPDGEEMFKYHGYSGNCPKPGLKPKDIVKHVDGGPDMVIMSILGGIATCQNEVGTPDSPAVKQSRHLLSNLTKAEKEE